MPQLAEQINEARRNGYSDDEIAGFLRQKQPDLAPKIKEAMDAGYGSSEILGHLAPPPPPAPPSAWSRFLSSAVEAINPIPAIQEYINRPSQWRLAQEAMEAGLRARREGRKPTPEETAIIERGMQANIGAGQALPLAAGAPATAALKAAQGDIAGAAGTLTGAYGVPLAVGYSLTRPAVQRGIATAGAGLRAAAPDVVKGAAKATVGYGLSSLPIPGPVQYGLGFPTVALGARQVGRGLRKGVTAGREALKARAAAAAEALAAETATAEAGAATTARPQPPPEAMPPAAAPPEPPPSPVTPPPAPQVPVAPPSEVAPQTPPAAEMSPAAREAAVALREGLGLGAEQLRPPDVAAAIAADVEPITRARNIERMARKLQEAGIGAQDATKLQPADLANLAQAAGIDKPIGIVSRDVVTRLKALEKEAAETAKYQAIWDKLSPAEKQAFGGKAAAEPAAPPPAAPTAEATPAIANALEEINAKFPVNPENPAERVLVAQGKPALTLQIEPRGDRLRIRTMRSAEPQSGVGSIALDRIIKAADKHGVTLELTASPYGTEAGRISKDALVRWYEGRGFQQEPGYDPALGYMIREPRRPSSGAAGVPPSPAAAGGGETGQAPLPAEAVPATAAEANIELGKLYPAPATVETAPALTASQRRVRTLAKDLLENGFPAEGLEKRAQQLGLARPAAGELQQILAEIEGLHSEATAKPAPLQPTPVAKAKAAAAPTPEPAPAGFNQRMAEFGRRMSQISKDQDIAGLREVVREMEGYRDSGAPKTDLDYKIINGSIEQAHSTLRQVEAKPAPLKPTPVAKAKADFAAAKAVAAPETATVEPPAKAATAEAPKSAEAMPEFDPQNPRDMLKGGHGLQFAGPYQFGNVSGKFIVSSDGKLRRNQAGFPIAAERRPDGTWGPRPGAHTQLEAWEIEKVAAQAEENFNRFFGKKETPRVETPKPQAAKPKRAKPAAPLEPTPVAKAKADFAAAKAARKRK